MERKEEKSRFPIFRNRLFGLMGDMSVTEFAKKTGFTRQTMSFYLNGERIPDCMALTKICAACGVTSDWLLGLSDDPNKAPSAVDDLKLSTVSVDAITRLSATERKGFEAMLSTGLFPVVCRELQEYRDIPAKHKFSMAYDTPNQYHEASSLGERAKKALMDMDPELGEAIAVLYGIEYAEYKKQNLVSTVRTMLDELDLRK